VCLEKDSNQESPPPTHKLYVRFFLNVFLLFHGSMNIVSFFVELYHIYMNFTHYDANKGIFPFLCECTCGHIFVFHAPSYEPREGICGSITYISRGEATVSTSSSVEPHTHLLCPSSFLRFCYRIIIIMRTTQDD